MRTRLIGSVSALLLFGLLLIPAEAGRPLTVLGSLTITKAGGVQLTTELVGVAVMANPVLDKAVSQQIPPFTLPVFIERGPLPLASGTTSMPCSLTFCPPVTPLFDTRVILTNTTADPLDIELTLRDAQGQQVGVTKSMTIVGHGTVSISAFELMQ